MEMENVSMDYVFAHEGLLESIVKKVCPNIERNELNTNITSFFNNLKLP